jgi:hypothetical protein
MFTVPPSIRAQRLATCKACKHFRPSTLSCGTIIIGNKLSPEDLAEAEENNKITHYRRITRLCGCYMPRKTKYSLYRCPINKWGRYRLSDEETELLRAFISGLPSQGSITGQTVRELGEWVHKMTGSRVGCVSCRGSDLISWLKTEIHEGQLDD